mmetsp:Transcript_39418/g.92638  ORF Transcript_39418/g.92638 Transcript_39418/m.92638 type:complete len:142 (+) Transcript_39418:2-427(+)
MAVAPADLVAEAQRVKLNSYSPYSKFRVGAACLTGSGKVYCGTNVENASFGLTCCAERIAIFSAVSHGEKEVLQLAVSTDVDEVKWCCGACCAVILEFGEAVQIHSSRLDGTFETKGIRDLVPFCFSKADLDKPRPGSEHS